MNCVLTRTAVQITKKIHYLQSLTVTTKLSSILMKKKSSNITLYSQCFVCLVGAAPSDGFPAGGGKKKPLAAAPPHNLLCGHWPTAGQPRV